MYFLLLLLSLLAVVIIAAFFEPVVISFFFDTNEMDMYAVARWIPFIRIVARIIEFRLHITVFVLRKKMVAGFMKPSKKSRSKKKLFDTLALSNTSATISYGFNEPYLTGIFCTAAEFAATLIRSADIALEPVFYTENDFLKISAKTELNTGKTLINMLRTKFISTRRRKNYGPAELN